MPTIDEAVALVRAADLPVLFLDTCSLVDVIRAPLRLRELRGCVEAATELLELGAGGEGRCTAVVASFVRGEWSRHAGEEAERLRARLAGFDEEADALHYYCTLMGVEPPFGRPEYRPLPLADRLLDLSRRLLDTALALEPDRECIIRAHGRAALYIPPSRKGGEIKDATILEETLEVGRRLKAAGFARKLVFCTSNRRDYCEAASRLHPSLAIDFGAVDLGFTTSLPWAVREIKTPDPGSHSS